MIPLLPRHRIPLAVVAGDGPRFAVLFRQTWRRLPLHARRRILAHWRGGPVMGKPFIELTHSCVALYRTADGETGGRPAYGVVTTRGHMLAFWSSGVDAMPDDVVQDLIAHELAHVVQWAADPDASASIHQDPLTGEDHADWMISCWGFDPESLDRWGLATGRTRVLPGTPENQLLVIDRVLREGR